LALAFYLQDYALHGLLQFLEVLRLLGVVLVVHRGHLVFLLLFFLRPFLFLLEDRRAIRDPVLLLLKLALLNVLFHNSIVFPPQPLQIKDIKYVVNLIVIGDSMLLKPLLLKINVEPFLATDKAERLFILLD
jgi:hypothetical protein